MADDVPRRVRANPLVALHPAVMRLVWQRVQGPLLAAASAVLISSIGYVLIADFRPFDALYMTVITLGTVGFGEIQPLDDWGRLWTIGVIFAGFGVFVYSSASLTALFVSGEVRATIVETRRSKVRAQLNEHVVVVGLGRVGRAAADAIVKSGRPCIAIDIDPDRQDEAQEVGAVFLCGDARDDAVLREAGVTRASAVVTALDDPSNAVVALTARSLAPTLRIVARVAAMEWHDRFVRAGVTHVVPVYESVGVGLAATALEGAVMGVLQVPGTSSRVEELRVGAGSAAVGNDLRSMMETVADVNLLGVRTTGGLTRWHEANEPIAAGDVLVAFGDYRALERMAKLVRPAADEEPQ